MTHFYLQHCNMPSFELFDVKIIDTVIAIFVNKYTFRETTPPLSLLPSGGGGGIVFSR